MENNKYQRGKIYKIICNETGLVYIGSTTEPTLARRLAGHKGSYKSYLNGKGNNVLSFKVLENDNYYIELICNAPCNSRDELNAIEGKYIRENECVNKKIEGRTKKQYYIDNSDKIKQYRIDNTDKIKQYKKQYRTDNADKIKQYRTDNADKIKQYRTDNADKIKQYKNEKHNCECGGQYTNTNKSTHLKSKKHQKYIETLKEV
jgi:hypothetical protein